jgi:hypothetical protein
LKAALYKLYTLYKLLYKSNPVSVLTHSLHSALYELYTPYTLLYKLKSASLFQPLEPIK